MLLICGIGGHLHSNMIYHTQVSMNGRSAQHVDGASAKRIAYANTYMDNIHGESQAKADARFNNTQCAIMQTLKVRGMRNNETTRTGPQHQHGNQHILTNITRKIKRAKGTRIACQPAGAPRRAFLPPNVITETLSSLPFIEAISTMAKRPLPLLNILTRPATASASFDHL